MDANGVFSAVFNATTTRLTTTNVGSAAAYVQSSHDANYVLATVFAAATNSLRTVAV